MIGTPVPQGAAMPKDEINRIITEALADAGAAGISGKAITPFLLDRIVRLTGGRGLATNIALAKHNAAVGARLAVALPALPRQ